MNDPVEQIKAKLDIIDVVGSYLELKKAGRNYKALCPFHKEKTPSFMVSQDKQLAYCFSCRKGGDMFTFVQEVEGVEFGEALRILAEKAHVEVTSMPRVSSGEKQRLYELLEATNEYFQKALQHPSYKNALQYFDDRGVTPEDRATFGLGYAPREQRGLVDYLLGRGFSKGDMVKAGVVTGKDVSGERVHDRFFDRVMFALHNEQGRIVGFAGRILEQGEPKYLNIPETTLYHKGSILYGWHEAKQAIRDTGRVIIVEGYMDVIASHRAGFKHVVGVSGVALTEEHMQLIKRLTNEVVLCFDEDSAGLEAKKRSFQVAVREEVNVLTVSLPDGKDPDELIGKEPEAFGKALDDAEPFMAFYLRHVVAQFSVSTPQGQKRIAQEVFRMVQHMGSTLEQEFYLKRLAEQLGSGLKTVFFDYKKYIGALRTPKRIAEHREEKSKKQHFSREEILLGIIIGMPEEAPRVIGELEEELFAHEQAKNLYKLLAEKYTGARFLENPITEEERRKMREYAMVLKLYYDEHFHHLPPEEVRKTLDSAVQGCIREYATGKVRTLQRQIRSASTQGDTSQVEHLTAELNALLPKLRR